ncbi:MAG: glycosyltransferase family 2 protein [Paludibacter sp.]|nr:glycosyltransferase family 2 protein [Paludibacter sp.]
MEHPLVSVIIPIYNMEDYLAETIESVMKSDFSDFELILMDDGSTDSSAAISKSYADNDPRIRFFTQENGGASTARNNAIKVARGSFILPVDADNLISHNFIRLAAEVLTRDNTIKVVSSEAEFIGNKSGKWKFPPFNKKVLARKNLIDNCAMYRKSDWEACGGYCNEILGREDWDFWISMFKSGGEFLRLPITGLYYRVRSNSKKVRTRPLKKKLNEQLNARHKAFFYKQLGGKLRSSRTWSRLINFIHHVFFPERIFVHQQCSEFEDWVYYAPERMTETAVGSKLFSLQTGEENSIEIIKFNQGSFWGKSEAQKHYASSDNNLKIGYYEKRTAFWCAESYFIQLKEKKSPLRASLIISVYKNTDFLKAVLDSLKLQTIKDFEIIISEDGEYPPMKSFLEQYSFDNPWQHITQKDEGWRKNQCLNKAIKAAMSEWLIFIDGDCVLHPYFVEMHLNLSGENKILGGKRVKLDEATSKMLLTNTITPITIQKKLRKKIFLWKGEIQFPEEGIYIPSDGIFGAIPDIRKISLLKGCNMSFSKKAINAINGFDEDYQLPAIGEDIDLTWRFLAAGYTLASVRNLAVQYHLYHPDNWVNQDENLKLMTSKQSKNEYFCKNGLKKINP